MKIFNSTFQTTPTEDTTIQVLTVQLRLIRLSRYLFLFLSS